MEVSLKQNVVNQIQHIGKIIYHNPMKFIKKMQGWYKIYK